MFKYHRHAPSANFIIPEEFLELEEVKFFNSDLNLYETFLLLSEFSTQPYQHVHFAYKHKSLTEMCILSTYITTKGCLSVKFNTYRPVQRYGHKEKIFCEPCATQLDILEEKQFNQQLLSDFIAYAWLTQPQPKVCQLITKMYWLESDKDTVRPTFWNYPEWFRLAKMMNMSSLVPVNELIFKIFNNAIGAI